MGTDVHVVVHGSEAQAAAAAARRRIDDLEDRWSRFRPTSEISRLAQRSGAPCLVSDDTFLLIERAVEAWGATAGRYDPTVGAAMVLNGYDRDFARLARTDSLDLRPAGPAAAAPGCDDVVLDAELRLVIIPEGTLLDPGGVAKGLAADLLSSELIAAGADGVAVNVGGDLRVRGLGPDEGRWPISIEDPLRPGEELRRIAVYDRGVATSSVLRRRWRHLGVARHHVIDPRTGLPAATALAGVTVIANDAWWGEAVATEMLLDPDPEHAVQVRADVSAMGVLHDGTVLMSPDLESAFA